MTKGEQARLTAWRLKVLRQAADERNVARVCRRFGMSRKTFYKWKGRHGEHGDAGGESDRGRRRTSARARRRRGPDGNRSRMMAGYPSMPMPSVRLARGCHGKAKLPCKRVAQARPKQLFTKGEAYKCSLCHGWHITSRRSSLTARARGEDVA